MSGQRAMHAHRCALFTMARNDDLPRATMIDHMTWNEDCMSCVNVNTGGSDMWARMYWALVDAIAHMAEIET